MTLNRAFFNPFRMLGLRRADVQTVFDELHTRSVEESTSLEEALLVVMSKIIENTRLLWKCALSCTPQRVERCAALAEEIHEQEEILTKDLIASDVRGSMLKSLMAFPHRLARIGDQLDVMLACCRAKARQDTHFSDQTEAELDQLFLLLLDMMTNTRDAFNAPDETLLHSIISESRRLNGRLEDYRLAYWQRLDNGLGDGESSPVYLEILNAIGGLAEHLERMCHGLLALKNFAGASNERDRAERSGLRSVACEADG